jgi:hypothetical protein
MAFFKKIIDILVDHGVLVLLTRSLYFCVAKFRLIFRNSELQHAKWATIKGSKVGETLYVLGNGPSLNITPLYLLKNSATMTFNGFTLMRTRVSWNPTHYMITDDLVAKDLKAEIPKMCAVTESCFFPLIHPSNTDFSRFIKAEANVFWLDPTHVGFRSDLPKCGVNNTVVLASLQVARYLGYSSVVLLGVDLSYVAHPVQKRNSRDWVSSSADPNHFDPRYFGPGRRFHDPQTDKMQDGFRNAKDYFTGKLSIKNATAGGLLETFDRCSLVQALGLSNEEWFHSFQEECRRVFGEKVAFDIREAEQFQESQAKEMVLDKGYSAKKNLSSSEVASYISGGYLVVGPFLSIYVISGV